MPSADGKTTEKPSALAEKIGPLDPCATLGGDAGGGTAAPEAPQEGIGAGRDKLLSSRVERMQRNQFAVRWPASLFKG